MKNIIKIDGIEYIKKSKYDSLEKKKKAVVKKDIKFKDCLILNPANTFSIFPVSMLEGLDKLEKIELSKYESFDILKSKILDSTEDNIENGIFNPRIKIGENIYSYEYIQKAKKIISSMEYDEDDFELFIHKSKVGEPLLIKFGSVGVLIAPRVETEEDAKGRKRE